MTIQELGSIGEFVGSVLLLVSIFYLALQVRQNSKTLSNTAFLDAVRDSNYLDHVFLEDPNRDRILTKGSESLDSLTEDELAQFNRLWMIILRDYCAVLRLEASGVLEKGEISASFETSLAGYNKPGIREWWDGRRHVIAFDEYRFKIDAIFSG